VVEKSTRALRRLVKHEHDIAKVFEAPNGEPPVKGAPGRTVQAGCPAQLVTRSTGGKEQHHKLTSYWTVETGGPQLRLKVAVRLDASYVSQSSAIAVVWNDAELEWRGIASIAPHEKGWPASIRYSETDETALVKVEAELVKRSLWALGLGAL